jgi:cytochrome c oxidase assembly factor CtaG
VQNVRADSLVTRKGAIEAAVSRIPIYSVYANLLGSSHGAALADQQVAGLVMWIPAGLVLTFVGIALFAAWLGESERRLRLTRYDLRSRARP